MRKVIVLINFVLIVFLSSCSKQELLIVTTTSLDNSGLLAYIIPAFEEEYNVKVKIVALGTGAALELGEMGEADILLVHAYDSEIAFVNDGYGEKRSNIMYNDFIFVGPETLDTANLSETLAEISENQVFYSRGDNSGTHTKELSLWSENGYDVSTFGDWYKETGQSMGSTLTMTSLSQFYTLTDRATYLSMLDNLDLVIAYQNREELKNQYGVIKVNPELHNRDDEIADLFYDWIIRDDIQELIGTYEGYGEQLFFPNS